MMSTGAFAVSMIRHWGRVIGPSHAFTTLRISPYLLFNGNCRQAMEFYRDALGGQLHLTTYGETPNMETDPKHNNEILHSVLTLNDHSIVMASDNINTINPGSNVALSIDFTGRHEIESAFHKLSAGGKVDVPLAKMFFGWFARFDDKYGVQWMLHLQEHDKK